MERQKRIPSGGKIPSKPRHRPAFDGIGGNVHVECCPLLRTTRRVLAFRVLAARHGPQITTLHDARTRALDGVAGCEISPRPPIIPSGLQDSPEYRPGEPATFGQHY